jgi:hypothetical protein
MALYSKVGPAAEYETSILPSTGIKGGGGEISVG